MTQYRTPLTANRFVADPEAPELSPKFEFRLGGPPPKPQPSSLLFGDRSPEYPDWAGDRYTNHDNREYRSRKYPEQEHSKPEYPEQEYYEYGGDGYRNDEHLGNDYADRLAYIDEPGEPTFDAFDNRRHGQGQANDDRTESTAGSRHGYGETAGPGRAARRRGGAHRLPAPPTALKGRAAVIAVAAGAVVAAGQSAFATGSMQQVSANTDLDPTGVGPAGTTAVPQAAQFAGTIKTPTAAATNSDAPQVLNVAQPVQRSQFNDILRKGQRFAKDRAAREAALMRPLFVMFAHGTYTSGFGVRWGAMHAGVDIAAPIGTPIYAVGDATVLDAGPASGFGMWVRLKHADGTITVYGHVDTTTVRVGQHVMAGDQIATVGNRGYSTGPHCHFEVWLNGSQKVDPLPWLASRGISLGPERD